MLGSLLAHPDSPRDRPGFLIAQWAAHQLERQLDLTVVVALVPDHVEQEDRMVIMKIHLPARLHAALDCISDGLGAVVQHLRDATTVWLDQPLFLGQVSRTLGGVLEDEDESYVVDVGEPLRSGRAWSRLTRMRLFRSQESSRASSRLWSDASGISTLRL